MMDKYIESYRNIVMKVDVIEIFVVPAHSPLVESRVLGLMLFPVIAQSNFNFVVLCVLFFFKDTSLACFLPVDQHVLIEVDLYDLLLDLRFRLLFEAFGLLDRFLHNFPVY